MIRQIAFTLLSAAFVITSASEAATAASRKNAHHALAAKPAAEASQSAPKVSKSAAEQEGQSSDPRMQQAASQPVEDPRDVYKQKSKGHHLSWCDVEAQCNGWADWVKDVESGKLGADQ